MIGGPLQVPMIWQLYLELFGTKPFFGMARVRLKRKIRNRNTRYAQDDSMDGLNYIYI